MERSGLAESSAGTQAAAGGAWVGLEVGIALAVIGLILAYRRLPIELRTAVKLTLKGGVVLYAGAYLYGISLQAGTPFSRLFVPSLAAIFAGVLVDELDAWCLVNNVIVLGLAVIVSAAAGFVVGVPVLVVGLLGLTLYDHYFANRSNAMFLMGGWFVKTRLPVLFVWPSRWRVDWDDLADSMLEYDHDDEESFEVEMEKELEQEFEFEADLESEIALEFEEELGIETEEELELDTEAEHEVTEIGESKVTDADDEVSWGIGMADIALPSALAVTVAASTPPGFIGVSLPVLGVLAGTVLAVFRLRYTFYDGGGGAGLPALTTGALGGYAIAAVLAAVIVL